MMREQGAKGEQMAAKRDEGMLNAKVELAVQASVSAGVLLPRRGLLLAGERGVEFRARDGRGYIQIPWEHVGCVRVDLYGRAVRGVEFAVEDNRRFMFLVSDGAELVRLLNRRLGRAKLVPARHALSALQRK